MASKQAPGTSDKKVHQHFLEEFSEPTVSQRQSIVRSKNLNNESLGSKTSSKKTPMTSLFQKSKFFQSSTANAENNPNAMNVPPTDTNHHYGHYQNQSTSPNRTLSNQLTSANGTGQSTAAEMGVMSNFTDKDSFPRRNITNKLRNASNLQHKKTTVTKQTYNS